MDFYTKQKMSKSKQINTRKTYIGVSLSSGSVVDVVCAVCAMATRWCCEKATRWPMIWEEDDNGRQKSVTARLLST